MILKKESPFSLGLVIMGLIFIPMLALNHLENEWISIMIYFSTIALAIFSGSTLFKVKINDGKQGQIKEIVKCIFLMYIALMPAGFVQNLLNASFSRIPMNEGIGFTTSAITNVVLILLIVIIGPISEELIFRGLIPKILKMKLSEELSILISSIMFASLHIGDELPALVTSYVLFKYLKKYNLKTAMMIHGGFNLIILLMVTIFH